MTQDILSHLSPDYPWKDRFTFFSEIDSTNTRLKAMAREGAPHGTVLAADCQTGGRGRLGRSFLSPSGVGMYMSILLRPDCSPRELMHLTCAAGCAMCDAVEKTLGIRPGIKWTNDLVYGGRKLAGILTEMAVGAGGKLDYAIVGIGINCCQKETDFPEEIRKVAGSLAMVTGKDVDRAKLAAAMMDALYKMDCSLLGGKEAMLTKYRQDCVTLGKAISVVRGEEVRHGTAVDLDEECGLIVRFDDGSIESVQAGEVSIRGMYGYV